MKTLLAVLTALVIGANPVVADVAALRVGDMKKLVVHTAPKTVSTRAFQDGDGGEKTLADWHGKVVLVNFWATWCAPCRHEMPMLAALDAEFDDKDFDVVTIATGPNNPVAIRKFFEEIGVDSLPRFQDPQQRLAAEMGVFGLPITVLLNHEGEEIARLRGDADWSSDSAKAIIKALIAQEN